jgi:hypothetical protein
MNFTYYKEDGSKVQAHFDSVQYERDKVAIEWDYIGEGWAGDYNPDDPDDDQLLRFTVLIQKDGEWEQYDDGSYCTQLPISTPIKALELISGEMLEYLQGIDSPGAASQKRYLQEMSWLDPNDAKEIIESNE